MFYFISGLSSAVVWRLNLVLLIIRGARVRARVFWGANTHIQKRLMAAGGGRGGSLASNARSEDNKVIMNTKAWKKRKILCLWGCVQR